MADKPAKDKRLRISKAQQITIVEVLITSMILGACIVLAIFLIKYINFNTKVITEKDAAINDYNETIAHVGACKDDNRDGKYSDKELEACDPDSVALSDVPKSLRFNVYETLSRDKNLESVARRRQVGGVCYGDGKEVNFVARYNQAKNDTERTQALQGMRECSSLRVISDALPDSLNTEALMASLNQLFIEAAMEPDSITPQNSSTASTIPNVVIAPVTFTMTGTGAEVIRTLDAIDRSIRTFNITSGTFSWSSGNNITMRANADAYYLSQDLELETKKTVKASDDKKEKK